jgi:hypothetical protein
VSTFVNKAELKNGYKWPLNIVLSNIYCCVLFFFNFVLYIYIYSETATSGPSIFPHQPFYAAFHYIYACVSVCLNLNSETATSCPSIFPHQPFYAAFHYIYI